VEELFEFGVIGHDLLTPALGGKIIKSSGISTIPEQTLLYLYSTLAIE
jgi:hypothetical protein